MTHYSEYIPLLRQYQEENDWTNARLADELNCNDTHLCSIMTGRRFPGITMRYRMREFIRSVYGEEYNRKDTEYDYQEKNSPIQNHKPAKVGVNTKPKQKLVDKIAHHASKKCSQASKSKKTANK